VLDDPVILTMFESITKQLDKQSVSDSVRDEKIDKLMERVVGWERCAAFREDCENRHMKMYDGISNRLEAVEGVCNEFNSIKRGITNDTDLLMSENKMVEQAKIADNELMKEILVIKEGIRKIENKFVVFDWSMCSVNWLWQNKKAVSAALLFISVWFYGVDAFARWSQWSFFPPSIGP
jgi:hypothetical protein